MAVLKIEPFSGISGDMFLAAMAQLADAREEVIGLPRSLGLKEAKLSFQKVIKCGIACEKVEIVDGTAKGESQHRHLSDILKIIDCADLPKGAKNKAVGIFELLAEAEAKVHGIPVQEVHFHEVGAVDSIIDVVGAAFLIDKLDIKNCYSDPICTGFGTVKIAHGKYPVPAPATKELLKGMPIYPGSIEAEMITPTGAAILKFLAPQFTSPPVQYHRTAYGAGSRDFEQQANCLCLSFGDVHDDSQSESLFAEEDLCIMQTQIDDMPGELLGTAFQEKLLEHGAVDFYILPIQMKKGRPGILLEVICPNTLQEKVAKFILEETTTLGIRKIPISRYILKRTESEVDTEHGKVKVKNAHLPSGKIRSTPEFEDCRRLSEKTGVPIKKIYRSVEDAIKGS